MAAANGGAPKRAAVFIDLSNFNKAVDALKLKTGMDFRTKIDFNKLLEMVAKDSEVIQKSIYFGIRSEDQKINSFIRFLNQSNFRTRTKEIKLINTGEGTKSKSNFDVEIAYDITYCILRRACDEIILVSGDSDFTCLVKQAKDREINFTIVSTGNTVAKELLAETKVMLLDETSIKKIIM